MHIMGNVYHACGGTYPDSVVVSGTDINQDTEITKKLDRIIDLLEKISRRVL